MKISGVCKNIISGLVQGVYPVNGMKFSKYEFTTEDFQNMRLQNCLIPYHFLPCQLSRSITFQMITDDKPSSTSWIIILEVILQPSTLATIIPPHDIQHHSVLLMDIEVAPAPSRHICFH